MSMSIGFGDSADETLKRAFGSYLDEQGAIAELVSKKVEVLRHYDAPGMVDAANLLFWGRSGSFLLASYLDSHDDLVLLPLNASQLIYPFLAEFKSLSIWEKLVAYPTYSDLRGGSEGSFFRGDFPISAPGYYAAVHALFAVYGDRPANWLDTRQRFIQFLQVAYAVAIGRCPANPRPLIIYSQHWTNDELARCFVEDFPRGRFIHTIRDPISAFDSWFDRQLDMHTYAAGQRLDQASRYLSPAVDTVRNLLEWDRAHRGMEARTCAIRFEDLHLQTETTMCRLAEWLGIPYRPSLLQSTFNGIPYVFQSGAASWVGARPENARRRSKNLNFADRSMMFALLQQNFLEWSYSSPRVFRRGWVRLCTIALLWLVPMKMEMLNARIVIKQQAIPALRNGRIGFACGAPLFLIMRRLRMILLIAAHTTSRLMGKRRLLKPL